MPHRHFIYSTLLILTVHLFAYVPSYAEAPTVQCRIINEYPHDTNTSTQGLFFLDGKLYESSGGFGVSYLAIVELETGRHLAKHNLTGRLFAEGITTYKNKVFLITWLSGNGYVHDIQTLETQASFAYRNEKESIEGWGLAFDNEKFILSSGTARLLFYEPEDFSRIGGITVKEGNETVRLLNELEYVGGMVLANLWKTDFIAVIDPASGQLKARIDISPLRQRLSKESGVANGIAYDKETGRLFVTGKRWSKLFQIEIDEVLWRQPVLDGK